MIDRIEIDKSSIHFSELKNALLLFIHVLFGISR